MKILVVSGFLGSGKTTFIKALAQHTNKDFAVLENEYGAAGIDGERLENSLNGGNGAVSIWEMTERCICCSAKGEFAASVLTISNAVDPEYLVVEPTGVGMLSRIMENLKQIEYERIALLAPVTMADAQNHARFRREYPELYADQIASAGTIVISKGEHLGEDEKNVLCAELRAMNPAARIIKDPYPALALKDWLLFLEQGWDGTVIARRSEEDAERALPDSFSITGARIASPEHLIVFLEDLVRGAFGAISRAKGQILCGSMTLQFDAAGALYSVTEAEGTFSGKAVFIGYGLERQKIRRRLLRPLMRGIRLFEQTGRKTQKSARVKRF